MPSIPTEALLDVNVVIASVASLENRMANLDDAAKPVLFVVT